MDDTDAGTVAQMQALQREMAEAPQIGAREKICGDFLEEFSLADASNGFAAKLQNLAEGQKLSTLRRCRRDGNCFYRCLLFGILERMCEGFSEGSKWRAKVEAKVSGAVTHCTNAGYESFAVEDMDDAVKEGK